MRRRRELLFLLASCAACEDDAAFLELPSFGVAESAVIAIERGGRVVEVTAYDLSSGPPVHRSSWPREETVRLALLVYATPLADLGLEAGVVPLAAQGEPGRSLYSSVGSYLATVTKGVLSDWTLTSSESIAALGLTVAGVDHCVDFEITSVRYPNVRPPVAALRLDGERVLLVDPGGTLSALMQDGLHSVDNPLPDAIQTACFEDSFSPRVWLLDVRGQLWWGRAQLPLSLTRAETPTVASSLHITAGITNGGEDELFALGTDARLRHYFRGEVEELHSFELDATYNIGAVSRRTELEALTVYRSSAQAVMYDSGEVRLISGPDAQLEGLSAAIFDQAYVVGTTAGAILRRAPGGWEELGRAQAGFDIFALLPFQGAYLAGGRGGFVAQLLPTRRFCEGLPVGGEPIRFLTTLGTSVVAIPSRPAFGQDIQLTILRPR
ncbi:MAG: hypothetical protein IT384_09675 [Deltaproteobacteria bacterium]|nr:hypothetical protein [Deltaproteobacteria bacterium]